MKKNSVRCNRHATFSKMMPLLLTNVDNNHELANNKRKESAIMMREGLDDEYGISNCSSSCKKVKVILIACLLCKRKFPTEAMLKKHKKKSRLHKENAARVSMVMEAQQISADNSAAKLKNLEDEEDGGGVTSGTQEEKNNTTPRVIAEASLENETESFATDDQEEKITLIPKVIAEAALENEKKRFVTDDQEEKTTMTTQVSAKAALENEKEKIATDEFNDNNNNNNNNNNINNKKQGNTQKQTSAADVENNVQWQSLSDGDSKMIGVVGDQNLLSPLNWLIVSNIQFFMADGAVGVECSHCANDDEGDRALHAVFVPSTKEDIGKTVRQIAFHHFPICPYFPSSERKKIKDCFNDQSYNSVLQNDQTLLGLSNFCNMVAGQRLQLVDDNHGIRRPPPSSHNILPIYTATASSSSSLDDQLKPATASTKEQETAFDTTVVEQILLDVSINTADTTEAAAFIASDDPKSISLYSPEDEDKLTPLHAFLRKQCIEAFVVKVEESSSEEEEEDEEEPGSFSRQRGKWQVGIRCLFCRDTTKTRKSIGVVFPRRTTMVYDACTSILQKHLLPSNCSRIPKSTMAELRAKSSQNEAYIEGIGHLAANELEAKLIAYDAANVEKIGVTNGLTGLTLDPENSRSLQIHRSSTPMTAHLAAGIGASFSTITTTATAPSSNLDDSHQGGGDGNSSSHSEAPFLNDHQAQVTTRSEQLSQTAAMESTSSLAKSSIRPTPPPSVDGQVSSFFSCCLIDTKDFDYCTEYMIFFMSQLEVWFATGSGSDPKAASCQLICRHCAAFPEDKEDGSFSLKTKNGMRNLLEHKVINHLFDCPHLPTDVKDKLIDLRKRHYRAALKLPVEKYYDSLWLRFQKAKRKQNVE